MLCLFQCLWCYLVGLPTLAVVAALLHVSDGRAEERLAVFLSDGEQGKLAVEVDKLFDDDLAHVATASLHRFGKRLLQFVVIVHVALAVPRRAHQRLDHAGEPYGVGSALELFKGLGVEVFGGAQPQLS